ncbi:ABL163Wp [Eremothecium gossypii ATCC 10895]|uniref:2,4-dienoyl-CoA reductase [(3E)-enoyl-CoA-producing] n=1 Tax=Eremothecium gossypii (strain ATCC 10895 / CBS 109.51 / FGSC 9923 / NRRL Y-1056) TaxID=284811 RepID=Q75E33_EREGS|nr:ABL163Wp [Eremothecium gossypii ATCC 10895]AAS50608.1 ABL163Wp [Eremothecium gossypii ATCC 10895]AEY94896.1 FABL163Wp [Eremothecium gossypii FDAG1]
MPNTLDKSYVQNGPWRDGVFQGKVVFVTGGAGTICRVQAEAMVLLGAKAAIIGRNVEKTKKAAAEIAELGDSADCVLGIGGVDVREVADMKRAVEQTVAAFGRIDYVIAGAAGNFLADMTNLSSRAFKTVLDIDLVGSYNTVKATLSELAKNKGAVLFVSATLHYTGTPLQAHVSAAKAGVDALSNVLAVELGPLGIRCNCIAPGLIGGTEGVDRLSGGLPVTDAVKKIPLQRPGLTKDIADGTVYLFSPAASYTTGTILVVDGGAWHLGNLMGTHFPETLKRKQSVLKSKF